MQKREINGKTSEKPEGNLGIFEICRMTFKLLLNLFTRTSSLSVELHLQNSTEMAPSAGTLFPIL